MRFIPFFTFLFLAPLLSAAETNNIKPSGAPHLIEASPAVEMQGAESWLFPVAEEGSDGVVLSGETGGSLVVGRFYVGAPAATVEWTTVVKPEEFGPVADHWHLFAHGAHWIVFSVRSADKSFLLKLDLDFNRLGIFPVVQKNSNAGVKTIPTNDMFMVAEPNGVAVAHFLPGRGHRIFRFDKEGKFLETIDFGGGRNAHANSASAEPSAGGFTVLAPQSLNPNQKSSVFAIFVDANWQPTQKINLIAEDNKNLAMPFGVTLASGFRVVHARVRDLTSPAMRNLRATQGASDEGAIVRYILDPDLKIVSQKVLVPKHANRPHAALSGDFLITTWDGQNATWLRLDKISNP